MLPRPSRANRRICSTCSHGLSSRLSRSIFCALVSLTTCVASGIEVPLEVSYPAGAKHQSKCERGNDDFPKRSHYEGTQPLPCHCPNICPQTKTSECDRKRP